MSPEMTDLEAAVTAQTTVIGSAVTYINGVAAQIADAAGDRSKSVALATEVRATADALAAAMVAGTPAA